LLLRFHDPLYLRRARTRRRSAPPDHHWAARPRPGHRAAGTPGRRRADRRSHQDQGPTAGPRGRPLAGPECPGGPGPSCPRRRGHITSV